MRHADSLRCTHITYTPVRAFLMRFSYIASTLLLAAALFLSGCYHATVVTDAEPSAQTIERPWASSFIAGLVPPSTVETAQQCPNGVARVETRLSFLNMVATALTFNLYSPMSITVTCAAGGSASLDADAVEEVTVEAGADEDATQAAFQEAIQQSRDRQAPVDVRFTP